MKEAQLGTTSPVFVRGLAGGPTTPARKPPAPAQTPKPGPKPPQSPKQNKRNNGEKAKEEEMAKSS